MREVVQLVEAVQADDTAAMERLLAQRPKLVHGFTEQPRDHGTEYWLPLHYAAEAGHLAAARMLLDYGAHAEARTRFQTPYHARATPLHLAAGGGHTPLVALLLDHEAWTESRDAHARSPLAWAVRGGHPEAVTRLLEAGAMVDPVNNADQTPLHEAIASRAVSMDVTLAIIEQLIAYGGQVNARCWRDPEAFTPLHRCVSEGPRTAQAARLLLEAGADPAIEDPAQHRTPLQCAEAAAEAGGDDWPSLIALLQHPPNPSRA
jgi:ankyrin repeat protein